MKKLLITVGLLIVLALIIIGVISFTGGIDSVSSLVGLAAPTVTPTPTAPAPEPQPQTEAETEAQAKTETEIETQPQTEDPTTEAEPPTSEPSPSPTLTPSPTPTEITPTPEPVVTDEPTAAPTATPTPLPTATPTPVVAQGAIQQEPAPTNTPPGVPPTSGDMSGSWDSNLGPLTLSQSGVSVAGDYRWYGGLDQGRITGSFVYNTNQITGLWISQNPLEQGFFNWRLLDDGETFSGAFENNGLNGQWCGVRAGGSLPAGCGFSGVWNLRFSAPVETFGQATLTQTGQRVTGSYNAADGSAGEIEGSVGLLSIGEASLSGTWRNANGETAAFEWRLNLFTGQTFQGRRQPGNSEWCGWREGVARPEACGF